MGERAQGWPTALSNPSNEPLFYNTILMINTLFEPIKQLPNGPHQVWRLLCKAAPQQLGAVNKEVTTTKTNTKKNKT